MSDWGVVDDCDVFSSSFGTTKSLVELVDHLQEGASRDLPFPAADHSSFSVVEVSVFSLLPFAHPFFSR